VARKFPPFCFGIRPLPFSVLISSRDISKVTHTTPADWEHRGRPTQHSTLCIFFFRIHTHSTPMSSAATPVGPGRALSALAPCRIRIGSAATTRYWSLPLLPSAVARGEASIYLSRTALAPAHSSSLTPSPSCMPHSGASAGACASDAAFLIARRLPDAAGVAGSAVLVGASHPKT